ncbi:hypothetical protein AAC387_Pa02g4998 [Persea americana]
MTMNGDAPEENEYDRAKEVKEFDESKIGCKGLVDSGATTIPRFFIHPNPQSLQLTQSSSSHLIPTIDLSHALSHRRSELIHQIRCASHTWGFFQVIHHDIPISVIEDTISAVRSFNELPTEIKSQHYHREMDSSVSFQTNFDLYVSSAASWRDTLQVRLGPEPPELDRIPDSCWRELMEWGVHVRRVGEVLMGLLSEGLGLEKGKLEELTCLEGRHLVAHYYPYCPQPDLTLGIASHTDPGVLTVLLQDQVGGLQVKHGEEWVEVKPMHGAIVVNIGDLLQMMSNDEYKSVDHRVLANPFREPRISIGVFFNPCKRGDADYFGPLPELLCDGKVAHYRDFTMAEFMGRLFSIELGSLVNHFKL